MTADIAGFLLGVYDQIEAFVLDDIAAKRAVVAIHAGGEFSDPCDAHDANYETIPCPTLLTLAQPYRDRAGWREEWAS